MRVIWIDRASEAMRGVYDLKPRLEVEGAIGYRNWGECK